MHSAIVHQTCNTFPSASTETKASLRLFNVGEAQFPFPVSLGLFRSLLKSRFRALETAGIAEDRMALLEVSWILEPVPPIRTSFQSVAKRPCIVALHRKWDVRHHWTIVAERAADLRVIGALLDLNTRSGNI